MADKKPKIVFNEKCKCPHCGKKLLVKKTKKILESAIPAEIEEKVTVEKDSQTELPKVEDPKRNKKKK